MDNPFARFKKIDAHSHIGRFGSPFDVNFDSSMLKAQMEEYNIEKTILCPAAATLNGELLETYRKMPSEVIPLYWVNANLGVPAYEDLEHYLRDYRFAGVKMQPLFDGFTADSPAVDPIMAESVCCKDRDPSSRARTRVRTLSFSQGLCRNPALSSYMSFFPCYHIWFCTIQCELFS